MQGERGWVHGYGIAFFSLGLEDEQSTGRSRLRLAKKAKGRGHDSG